MLTKKLRLLIIVITILPVNHYDCWAPHTQNEPPTSLSTPHRPMQMYWAREVWRLRRLANEAPSYSASNHLPTNYRTTMPQYIWTHNNGIWTLRHVRQMPPSHRIIPHALNRETQEINPLAETCPICLEAYSPITIPELPAACGHPLCLQCFGKISDNRCPICRGPLREPSPRNIS